MCWSNTSQYELQLPVSMQLYPLSQALAHSLLQFSQDFAHAHRIALVHHHYSATNGLELTTVGPAAGIVKLFLTLHSMQKVEHDFAQLVN